MARPAYCGYIKYLVLLSKSSTLTLIENLRLISGINLHLLKQRIPAKVHHNEVNGTNILRQARAIINDLVRLKIVMWVKLRYKLLWLNLSIRIRCS